MDLHISIMDLHNSIMDLHNSIMDLHNSINDVQFAVQDWRRAVRKRGGSFLRESQSEVGECVIGMYVRRSLMFGRHGNCWKLGSYT